MHNTSERRKLSLGERKNRFVLMPAQKKVRKFVTETMEEILRDLPRAGSAAVHLLAWRVG